LGDESASARVGRTRAGRLTQGVAPGNRRARCRPPRPLAGPAPAPLPSAGKPRRISRVAGFGRGRRAGALSLDTRPAMAIVPAPRTGDLSARCAFLGAQQSDFPCTQSSRPAVSNIG